MCRVPVHGRDDADADVVANLVPVAERGLARVGQTPVTQLPGYSPHCVKQRNGRRRGSGALRLAAELRVMIAKYKLTADLRR